MIMWINKISDTRNFRPIMSDKKKDAETWMSVSTVRTMYGCQIMNRRCGDGH